VASCLGWHLFRYTPVRPHRGDGTFKDLTRRFGPLVVLQGWTISLPPFDLGKPEHTEYHLASLTNIRSRCGVYFAVVDSDRPWRELDAAYSAARVRLQLVNSMDNCVIDVEGRLCDFTWWTGGSHPGFAALYDLDTSFFEPDEAEEYRLRVW